MKQEIEYDQCPHCQKEFEKKDILEHFLNAKNDEKHNQHEFYKDYTNDEIYKVAEMYGYTKENPQYFENDITGIEYSRLYDGILIYQCNSCKHHWGRFSGIPNIEPEKEVRYRLNIPIQKFNSGNGATLCYSCSKIIDTGLNNKQLLCDECKINLNKLKTN